MAEIEAGRELDARIAVEVMGWRYPKQDGLIMRPRPWSTDRAFAMEVVDRLIERGVEDVGINVRPDGCFVAVLIRRGLGWGNVQQAHSLPLAICRAALQPEVLSHLANSVTGSHG